MKKVAVILSGCGFKDGSEIHETISSLLAIEQNGAEYTCFSIDKKQFRVVNHLTGDEVDEERSMLVEAARIYRKAPKTLEKLSANDFDALVIPGGSGAALNLCSYGYDGEKYIVDKNLENIILEFVKLGKPICALCIAPVILAKVLKNVRVTIGNDEYVSKIIEKVGAVPIKTQSGEICVDDNYRVVTAPCYMLADNIKTVYDEVLKAITKLLTGF